MMLSQAQKTSTQRPLLRVIWSAFWDGFSKPSRLAAVAMMMGFVCTATFSMWFFSPQAIAGRMGDYLPRSSMDAEGFATVKAIRLGVNGINVPTIVALGSSTTAQSLANGKFLRDTIERQTGKAWQFVALTTPQQSPLDQLALLETALAGHDPGGPPLVILMSASGLRMTWTEPRMLDSRFRGRIGLRSSWVTDELTRLGANPDLQTGIYVFDNFGFVCLNGTEALMRAVLGKPAHQSIATYAVGKPATGEKRAVPKLGERYLEAAGNAAEYFEFLHRFIDRLRAFENVHVVLIDEPFAPDAIDTLGLADLAKDMANQIEAFADINGVTYLTPAADAKLGADDFHDALHVLKGAPQERVQNELAADLLDYFERQGL